LIGLGSAATPEALPADKIEPPELVGFIGVERKRLTIDRNDEPVGCDLLDREVPDRPTTDFQYIGTQRDGLVLDFDLDTQVGCEVVSHSDDARGDHSRARIRYRIGHAATQSIISGRPRRRRCVI
jgi:hypothetical protein